MSGQNTEKQILAMVILLVISVASLGAYVWFDNGRRTEATSEVFERDSERGAHLFATNCRVCHGNDGAGRESNSSLVGVALNKPSNTFAWRTENAGQLAILQNRYRFTIACGRNGTPMPPWSLDQGGSLNTFKIENLVTMITTNAGDAWHLANEVAIEEDETAIGNLEIALGSAEDLLDDGGWSDDLEAALAAVAAAEADDAQLARLRDAVAQAGAELDALSEDGADENEIAAAEVDVAAANSALADYERPYARLVLAFIKVATADSDDDSDPLAEAQGRLNEASSIARGVAEERAWLKVVTDLEIAQSDLDEAEERFAVGLPIALPPAQVTSETCGQVHSIGTIEELIVAAEGEELGGWLASRGSDDG